MPFYKPASTLGLFNPQALLGSRALNTVYTNNNGRPIFVSVWMTQDTGVLVQAEIDVGLVATDSGYFAALGDDLTLKAIVPPGATYKVLVPLAATNFSILSWTEQ